MKDFRRFIELVKLSGRETIDEVLLDASKKDIKAYAKSSTGMIGMCVSLNNNPFEIDKELAISSIAKLNYYLDMIDKASDVSVKDNRICFKGKGQKGNFLLKKPEFILTKIDGSKFKTYIESTKKSALVKVNAEDLKGIEEFTKLTQQTGFDIEVNKNEMKVSVGDSNSDNIEKSIKVESDASVKVTVPSGLLDIVKVLSGNVNMYLGEGVPVRLEVQEGNISAVYIIGQKGK